MWIRSQDKKSLVKVNDIYISRVSKGYNICTGHGNCIGTYKEEKTCFKVLDMIQNLITKEKGNLLRAIYQEPNGKAEENMVFQMPQDYEVQL